MSTTSRVAGISSATAIPRMDKPGVPYSRRNTCRSFSAYTSHSPSLKKMNYKKQNHEKSNNRCLDSYASRPRSTAIKSSGPQWLAHRCVQDIHRRDQHGRPDDREQQIQPRRDEMGEPMGRKLLCGVLQCLHFHERDRPKTKGP